MSKQAKSTKANTAAKAWFKEAAGREEPLTKMWASLKPLVGGDMEALAPAHSMEVQISHADKLKLMRDMKGKCDVKVLPGNYTELNVPGIDGLGVYLMQDGSFMRTWDKKGPWSLKWFDCREIRSRNQ